MMPITIRTTGSTQNHRPNVNPNLQIEQVSSQRERERVYLPQNTKKIYKIIVNITIVAGYQIGKPIKLVAYSTN